MVRRLLLVAERSLWEADQTSRRDTRHNLFLIGKAGAAGNRAIDLLIAKLASEAGRSAPITRPHPRIRAEQGGDQPGRMRVPRPKQVSEQGTVSRSRIPMRAPV